MKVIKYSTEMAQQKFKGKRSHVRRNYVTINNILMYNEKCCIMVKLPAKHELAFGIPEGEWLGFEQLILTEYEKLNPALVGRE